MCTPAAGTVTSLKVPSTWPVRSSPAASCGSFLANPGPRRQVLGTRPGALRNLRGVRRLSCCPSPRYLAEVLGIGFNAFDTDREAQGSATP